MVDTINFQITFPEASTLKKIVEVISGLMKDCVFYVTANGLFLDSIDETRICLISLNLPNDYFSVFKCNQPSTISVRLASLQKLLKFCESQDTITMTQRQSHPDDVDLMIESRQYRQTMNFTLKLTRLEQEQTQADKIAAESTVILSAARFASLMRDLSGIGSVVRIQTAEADSSVTFQVDGEDANAMITTGSGKDDDEEGMESKIEVKKEVDMKFTIRYLILFSKASALSNIVKIELSNNNPAKIVYEFGSGGTISFLLACSVDGEEDEDAGDAGDDGDDI